MTPEDSLVEAERQQPMNERAEQRSQGAGHAALRRTPGSLAVRPTGGRDGGSPADLFSMQEHNQRADIAQRVDALNQLHHVASFLVADNWRR
jgi:hypothetical protein